MTPELRPYQEHLMGEVRSAFKEHRRVLLQSPTGSGKTVCFAWLGRRVSARGKRVLVLVHRAELLRQTCDKLDDFGVPYDTIEASVRGVTRAPVAVASVQTLARRLAHYQDAYDLIIIDESHHAVAGSWKAVLDAMPKAYVLGVTASPERLDGRGLGDVFEHMVLGPSVRELIDQGFLADYRAFTAHAQPDLSRVKSRAGDYDTKALADAMSAPILVGDAVEHYRHHADGKPAIAFCVTVAHAEAVAEQFRQAGYRSESVDGSLAPQDRAQRINGLANGNVQVLTSCQLVGEGLDIPAVTAAILLRPTQSLALSIQQVGRALRPKPDGSHAVILDHAGNLHRHGLPCAEREWSLDAAKRKAKTTASPVKTCLHCYAVLPAGTRQCPNCGNRFAAEPRPAPETMAGQLVEVSRDFWDHDGRPVIQRTRGDIEAALAKCKTPGDVKELARALAFRPGWAIKQVALKFKVPDADAAKMLGYSGRAAFFALRHRSAA